MARACSAVGLDALALLGGGSEPSGPNGRTSCKPTALGASLGSDALVFLEGESETIGSSGGVEWIVYGVKGTDGAGEVKCPKAP